MTSSFPSSPADTRRRRRQAGALPEVQAARCTGCGRCVAACPLDLLFLEVQHWKKRAVLQEAERCTACARCEQVCPFDAIHMAPQATSTH